MGGIVATKLDELKWKLFNKKRDILFEYGIKNGLIFGYDDKLLERLRDVNYGGLPASLIILNEKLCNGYCYDRGPLISLGFGDDDFQIVDADIDSLRLNPEYIDEYKNNKIDNHYAEHCFAERKLKDGIVLVYDASLGLVFEKSFYYKLEHPKIRVVNNKEKTLNFLREEFLEDSSLERDKYILPLILPNLEKRLTPIQPFYEEQLKEEIRLIKEKVNYDELCKEIHDDMKRKKFIK